MGFGTSHIAKFAGQEGTQQDVVEDQSSSRPSLIESSPNLPGLQDILSMSEHDLVTFFTTVLKMRTGIVELDLLVGEYPHQEVLSRVPGSANMHEKAFPEMARIIVLALLSNPRIVGIRIRVEHSQDGGANTLVWLKMGDREPIGPDFDEEGNPIEPDAEFKPSLRLYHAPRA